MSHEDNAKAEPTHNENRNAFGIPPAVKVVPAFVSD